MDHLIIVILQLAVGIANIVVVSFGLAIVFGMMRVINFAHGEFLMLGGYATLLSNRAGLSIWLAIFVVAPLFVAFVGVLLERLVIRHLYGRMIDTMLATWGISLALIGFVTVLLGNTVSGISTPLGNLPIGRFSISLYELLTVVVAVALVTVGWWVLARTRMGLIALATMQDRSMAAALGVDPKRVYAITFGLGAMVTGLAGGLIAPMAGVFPTIGATYIARAFITVISGGDAILTGTALAATTLGGVNTAASFVFSPVIGEVAFLAAAVLMLRLLPKGITGRFFDKAL